MRWLTIRSRRQRARERAEEMRAHLEEYADQLVARGLTPEAARREARLKFGNPRVKLEEVEAMTRMAIVETLGRDLRTALRGLRATPGFTAVVLAVLTLAMGATTAIYSVVDAVVLRRLPFTDSERLVAIDRAFQGRVVMTSFAAQDFLALRELTDVFDGMAAVASRDVVVGRDGRLEPGILRAQRVSAEFFPVLRAAPAIGRVFTRQEEVAGSDRVAVISHGLWQRRFGGVPDVLGKRLPATGGDLEVIGVMPRGFAYPAGEIEPTDLWVPYVIPERERTARIAVYLRLIGRLRDDVTIEQAQARVAQPPDPREGALILRNLHQSLTGNTRPWMLMLLGSVAFLLLLACVNIANLLLVRATVRLRELGVRSALGATRWDIARMLLAESLVLSIAGTAFGTLAAWLGIAGLRSILPSYLPRLADISIDLGVLGVAAAAAITTGIGAGLAPVFHSSRAVAVVLRQNGRTDTPSSARQRLRATLLTAQVALAVVLLVGAALFLRSFSRLMAIDVGLDYRNVLTVDVQPTASDGNAAALARVLEQVRAIPGVSVAALARNTLPFTGSSTSVPLRVPGRDGRPRSSGSIKLTYVTADYFRALRYRLLRGRSFTDGDVQGTTPVVVLNDTAARTLFPNEESLDQRVMFGRPEPQTVVGVVADVRGFGPEDPVEPQAFVPLAQTRAGSGTLFLRVDGSPAAILPQVKAAIWIEFPDLAIPTPATLEERFAVYIAERRFSMFLLGLFGLLGVTIASVGLYGVTSYVVSQRTREIGIRMALGAQPSTMLRSVLLRTSTQAAIGVLLGFAMARLLARSVEPFLFEVDPRDVRLYGATAAVLALAALMAAYLPARRASHVDPLIALRTE
jgi:predicted permease